MKLLIFVLCICLLTGTVTAKAADAVELGITPAGSTVLSPGIFTLAGYTECSDDSAQVGTPAGMGELDVDSIPDGATVYLDGSPWTYKHCIGHFPDQICLNPPVYTPYKGFVETGTHSITFSRDGYKSYSGTVKICSQKVSYVHKDLVALTTTTTTTVTTTTTAVPTTTATTAAATTTAAVTATTAAAGTTSAAVTAAATAAATQPVAGSTAAGTGSLSVITTPAGAAIYIDGIQRGISPATIPGLAAGSHTVLLKREGYQDLSTPVSITAGIRNEFSTGLTPLAAEITPAPLATATTQRTSTTKPQSPGFGVACGLVALGALLFLRK